MKSDHNIIPAKEEKMKWIIKVILWNTRQCLWKIVRSKTSCTIILSKSEDDLRWNESKGNLATILYIVRSIDRTLKSKLFSANYNKSKFLIIGKEKFRKSTLETLEKDPLQMGGVKIEHSEQEQYLGDVYFPPLMLLKILVELSRQLQYRVASH